MAGTEDRVTFPPLHNSTSSSDMINFYSTVRPEYITRLAEIYRNDFELFWLRISWSCEAAIE